ncbi:MAG TPA: hypothetical protein VHV30_15735 [Polyangiaceae bacterium]|jgi:hypothetical protein|nr:hypothetical protein [Polyangiaceae bacterium]
MPRSRPAIAAALVAVCGACATAETPGPPPANRASSETAEGGAAAEPPSDDAAATAIPPVGTSDATMAPDAPTSCGSLPLCDGFEGDAVGSPPSGGGWSVVSPDCSGSGTLAVDDSQAHGGTRSVKVSGGGGYCDHVFLEAAAVVPELGSQIYARFFVRLDAALGQGHTSFLAMTDAADGGKHVRMGGQDAILMYNRESDDATLPTLSQTGIGDTVAIAAGAWTCIELHIDESAGTIDTWVDGKEVPGLVEDGTPVADISTEWLSKTWRPTLTDFGLGWESYAGQAMTLWFDDVALASQRIGCGG